MPSILDQIAASAQKGFRPERVEDVFAGQVAVALDDLPNFRFYLALLGAHSVAELAGHLSLARRDQTAEPLALRFRRMLATAQSSSHPRDPEVMAFKVERRAVAVAVFRGLQMEFSAVRHLQSDSGAAERSTLAFLQRILALFPNASVAFEQMGSKRSSTITLNAAAMLKDQGVPLFAAVKEELLAAFAYPALPTRQAYREVAAALWPRLAAQHSSPSVLDAAGVGLLVAIRHLVHGDEVWG